MSAGRAELPAAAGSYEQAPLGFGASAEERDVSTARRQFRCFHGPAWRHVDEMVETLAHRAPNRHDVFLRLGEGGSVIVDGTPIAFGRIAVDEPYFSMKHKE